MAFLEREYEVSGQQSKIFLEIFEPQFLNGDFICNYRIYGSIMTEERRSKSFGVDKLQSISLAFMQITAELESISDEIGVPILWMGDSRVKLI
jgi:hypothetical protein